MFYCRVWWPGSFSLLLSNRHLSHLSISRGEGGKNLPSLRKERDPKHKYQVNETLSYLLGWSFRPEVPNLIRKGSLWVPLLNSWNQVWVQLDWNEDLHTPALWRIRLATPAFVPVGYVFKVMLLFCYTFVSVEEPQNKARWGMKKKQGPSNQSLSVSSKKHGPSIQVVLEIHFSLLWAQMYAYIILVQTKRFDGK